ANCSGTHVSCFGGNNGSATVGGSGGTIPYSFHWNTGDSTASIANRPAGTYCVTVTDAHGCSASCCFTITQPASPVTASCNGTHVSCFNGNNGSASVAPGGGTAPYSFHW